MSITGKSPLEFMRILRLKRGKQLLEKSQLSISQIAYQVGLSPKQFAKYFKEEYGRNFVTRTVAHRWGSRFG